jgi:secondary thiamine-phosphate synthase enzyme
MQTLTSPFASSNTRESVAEGSVSFATFSIEIETATAPEFRDITDDVVALVRSSGVLFGQVSVFSLHTTAAIRINENEPLLLRDLARTIRHLVPSDVYYEHNDFGRRTVNMNDDECANGHAHCQHLLLGASETVPVLNGAPALGRYQRIFLVELDHPRAREVLVSVVGIRECR